MRSHIQTSRKSQPGEASRRSHLRIRLTPVPPGSYGWTDINDYVRGELTNLVLSTSEALAELATAHGDVDLAVWAVRQGLLACTADDSLFTRFLHAGAADSPAHVARIWKEINDRLAALGETPSTELYELYRRLRGSP